MRPRRCGSVTVVRRGQRHVRFLRFLADRLSRGDHDLRADLVQEGLIALWMLPEARRLDAESCARVERRAAARRMFHYVRGTRERRWKPSGATRGRVRTARAARLSRELQRPIPPPSSPTSTLHRECSHDDT